MAPRHAESLLDVWLDLGTQAQNEAALRVGLQIPADVGNGHRVTRECHRDAGPQLESRGVFGGQQQRQKRIMVDLAGQTRVLALLLEDTRQFGHPSEVGEDAAVDLEAARLRGALKRHTREATVSASVGSMSAAAEVARTLRHRPSLAVHVSQTLQ